MITIKIRNAREIVRRERGIVVGSVAPLFTNLERRVEAEIIREIQKVFADRQIEAEFAIVVDDGGAEGFF